MQCTELKGRRERERDGGKGQEEWQSKGERDTRACEKVKGQGQGLGMILKNRCEFV